MIISASFHTFFLSDQQEKTSRRRENHLFVSCLEKSFSRPSVAIRFASARKSEERDQLANGNRLMSENTIPACWENTSDNSTFPCPELNCWYVMLVSPA